MQTNSFPKLHNATWPGIVGKGPDSEPPISFDKMLEMTAKAEVNGIKFDGVDLGLLDPHINIDSSDDEIRKIADKIAGYGLNVGSLVAPIWGGPTLGSNEDRKTFIEMVKKSCRFGKVLREHGVRTYGVIRIDSASSPEEWSKDAVNNTKLIAQTFREACDVAADYDEKLAAEGEICWGGMHSWKRICRIPYFIYWATTPRKTACFQKTLTGTIAKPWKPPLKK
jgi:sugar phosphate isomerase/epimerase